MTINAMTQADWPQVKGIYVEGIETGNATFETKAPDWEEWNSKYIDVCRLVARDDERVLGWAALLPVSSRAAFSGVAELSIYLSSESTGKGIGTRLLSAVIEESESKGFWTIQSGIFPENTGSIRLHEKMGFREIGVREKLGKLNGVWRDVVMMERRSETVGTD